MYRYPGTSDRGEKAGTEALAMLSRRKAVLHQLQDMVRVTSMTAFLLHLPSNNLQVMMA